MPIPTQMAITIRVRRLSAASDPAFSASAAAAASCAISAEVFDVVSRSPQSSSVEPEVRVRPDEIPHWPLLKSSVSRRAHNSAEMACCTYASCTEACFEDKRSQSFGSSMVWLNLLTHYLPIGLCSITVCEDIVVQAHRHVRDYRGAKDRQEDCVRLDSVLDGEPPWITSFYGSYVRMHGGDRC